MSGIVAIMAAGGETIDRLVVERMLDAQRHRGPHGAAVWIDGPAALGYCQLAVTPEAVTETQPAFNASGDVRGVLDGRLDNRGELIDALRAGGVSPRGTADVDILLCAYDAWGEACVERFLGDFAFAIWDARRRALVCARDVLGGRPLYIHRRGDLTALASEVAPLLVHPSVRREPNEGFVAECVSGHIVHRTETVWRDITRLDPGHVLTVEGAGHRTRRYWQLNPRFEILYTRDEEYAAHLGDLIGAAIRPRLRTQGRLGVMLSGGLDSSSIVGAMHQLHAVNGFGPLPTYSIVDPGEAWDETPFIEAVAAKWPTRPRHVPSFRASGSHLAAAAVRVQDLPPYPNGEMANTLFETARADNVRVLLTGTWSDSWLSGSYEHYADLAGGLRLHALWKQLRAQPDRVGIMRPRSMFRSLVWPLVPQPVRSAIKRALGRDGVPPWVTRRLASAVALRDRLKPPPAGLPFRTRAQAESHQMAFSGDTLHGSEAHERSASLFGLDTRHPFGDRRILEFGLAIPEEQRWRGATTKFVLRNAARDWLPPVIRERTTDTGASGVMCRTVQELVASGLWQNSVMARRGWVDTGALSRAFTEMSALHGAGDERYDDLANRLWLVCAVELWARHVLEEKPHV
jgi:asparagine synthase (glutamine-hydrolysing)